MEQAALDLTDAYCRVNARDEELGCRLSCGLENEPEDLLPGCAGFLGFKSAPLMGNRLAAALTRLLQDCVNAKRTRLQHYMDDPYFLPRGTKTARYKILSSLCLRITTAGITMAWHKAMRGPDLERIETCPSGVGQSAPP